MREPAAVDLLPALSPQVWDTSWLLDDDGIAGNDFAIDNGARDIAVFPPGWAALL